VTSKTVTNNVDTKTHVTQQLITSTCRNHETTQRAWWIHQFHNRCL